MTSIATPSYRRRTAPRRRQRPWMSRLGLKLLLILVLVILLIFRYFNQKKVQIPTDSMSTLFIEQVSWLPNPSGKCPQTRKLDWNSEERNERFPSVEERVCYYMTRWYDKNYKTNQQWPPALSYRLVDEFTMEIYRNRDTLLYTMAGLGFGPPNHMKNDVPFFVFSSNTSTLVNWEKQTNWALFLFYNAESIDFVNNFAPHVPVILNWGDQEMHMDVNLPVAGKWRFNDLSHHTRPAPILVPLEGGRHYRSIPTVPGNDIPWDEKQTLPAVWRGNMAGIVEGGKFYYDYNFTLHPLDTCLRFPRCRLVYKHNSNPKRVGFVDVGFASCQHEELRNVEGVDMMRPKMDMAEMLKHKMIISIEGNDVASGLKWNLYSNSVVLMPPPVKSIFSMEFLLEPYVHYVPITNIDDVQSAIDWVLQHDDEAEQIAKRATNFIEDLFYHPDAERDNAKILKEISNRISALWEVI